MRDSRRICSSLDCFLLRAPLFRALSSLPRRRRGTARFKAPAKMGLVAMLNT